MQSQTGTGPLKSADDAELREDMVDCTKYRRAILEQVITDDPSAPEELNVIMAGVKRSLQPILERRIKLLYGRLVSCANLMQQAGIAIKVHLFEYAKMITDELLWAEDLDSNILALLSQVLFGRLRLFRRIQIEKAIGCREIKVSFPWVKNRSTTYGIQISLRVALKTLAEQFERIEFLESDYTGIVREGFKTFDQEVVADAIKPFLKLAELISQNPSYESVERLLQAEQTLLHNFDEANRWIETVFHKHAQCCRDVMTQSHVAVGSVSLGPTGNLRSCTTAVHSSLVEGFRKEINTQYLLIRKRATKKKKDSSSSSAEPLHVS
ncbi:hypothetical protein HDU76_013630 [Blyttiomyces sp. JEL0837]|nr:hypothetical protein HDU76_013630 [Blyttiomyces sp. JEL0837]